jgi:hypothetical protein
LKTGNISLKYGTSEFPKERVMLQKISSFAGAVSRHAIFGITGGAARYQDAWKRDPLSHPALAGMSAAELADLPHAGLRAAVRE